jgi:hypothetical protein
VLKDNNIEASVKFSIPQSYPVSEALVCSALHESELISDGSNELYTPSKIIPNSSSTVSTTNIHLKRKKAKAPLPDTEDRRSEKLKGINNGFKSSSCPSKNCFCCNIVPPTLSHNVIRSLGKDLCNIPLKDLSEEVLKKKPLAKKGKTAKVIQPTTNNSSNPSNNEDKPQKKRKQKCEGARVEWLHNSS